MEMVPNKVYGLFHQLWRNRKSHLPAFVTLEAACNLAPLHSSHVSSMPSRRPPGCVPTQPFSKSVSRHPLSPVSAKTGCSLEVTVYALPLYVCNFNRARQCAGCVKWSLWRAGMCLTGFGELTCAKIPEKIMPHTIVFVSPQCLRIHACWGC